MARAHATPSAASMPKRVLGALGIVYGDIGTSPLYTIRECFSESQGFAPRPENVYGVLSLVTWALLIIVTVKYVTVILRADNRGEGGILALTALALRGLKGGRRSTAVVVGLGLFGASLFYGDGVITPAISVLSAVEGLEVAAPVLRSWVLPITVAILVALFAMQYRGTAKVGALFGPVMALWFAVLAGLGLVQVVQHPEVLLAFDPRFAIDLFIEDAPAAFILLGAVVLAVTGAEALYVDIGHFGVRPIRIAWIFLVFPALLLNYYGQGALVILAPAAVESPFYYLVPSWGILPMVVLATAATVIASQAVISGAFSLTRQAVQLGYLPRMEIRHTSAETIGQIYVPRVNWALFVAVLTLVLGFGSSSSLAAAYGIAVTGEMMIASILAFVVAHFLWRWRLVPALLLFGLFFVVDASLFSSNALKLAHGGWFPLVVGLAIFALMMTWRRGRAMLYTRRYRDALPIAPFVRRIAERPPTRVPGTAIFMTGNLDAVPFALLHNLKHNKVLHQRVVLLKVETADLPWLDDDQRIEMRPLGDDMHAVKIRYGFQEQPDIPSALRLCGLRGLAFDLADTSFFLSRETFVPSPRRDLPSWQEAVFITMANNALNATEFFRIPANRVVELGSHLEI